MKVSQEQIENILANSVFENHIFFAKAYVLSAKLPNGFVLVGVGACVDPREFDEKMGHEVALEQIVDQLWKLEGYLLQDKMETQF